jgi:phage terminase large subunit GpA-like protein
MEIYDGAGAIERAWRDGLKPDPLLTISQWADRYRVLSQRASSEPGRWRTQRTPYLKEIMDCLSPASPVQRVALMKGAQIGGTECGNCWIGYVIHQAPGPMMAVAPTVELAKRNSKQRIDPLIEESEVLRELVKERRSRDSGNTVLSKEFPGDVLIMTGANSAVGLRSMPARYLTNPCRELLVAGRPWRYLISETCADVAGCGRCFAPGVAGCSSRRTSRWSHVAACCPAFIRLMRGYFLCQPEP